MTAGDGTSECVFCTRAAQPPALLETASLYVMPDKYPLCRGHVLIISREHLPCYGAATSDLARELDAATARVQAFLGAAYGEPGWAWENGVAGQSVYHAHLHLIPSPLGDVPALVEAETDLTPVRNRAEVRDYFARHGCYRYLELAGARYLLPGHSPALTMIQRLVTEAIGLRRGPDGAWIKTTTPDDVADVARRWEAAS